ncbi:MAG: 50S ribosomal protein L14 [Candidatus Yanofskybacteria bacterium]|nr:50S ribosomal protein L14 [Candidatus Yanofskybacteria bacterium]
MIQPQTQLTVADNTGAKMIQCFRVLGGTRRRYARIGDVIVAAVKDAEPRRLVKKHEIVHAVIVRQRQPYRRADGSSIYFDENAAVIIEKGKKEPRGNRIFGPIPRELREAGYTKIASLSSEVL